MESIVTDLQRSLFALPAACRRAPAGRTRRAGTRDTPRAASGRSRTARRRRAGPTRACAAARAACASRPGAAAAGARAQPPRGIDAAKSDVEPIWRTTSRSIVSGRGQQQHGIRRLVRVRKPHDEPIVGPQRLDVDVRAPRGCARTPPWPTARARGRRAATGGRRASRRARRGSARCTSVRSSGTWPVAACCSARYWRRFSAAQSVEVVIARASRSSAAAGGMPRSSRVRARRWPGRTRAAGSADRPSRTASFPARPAPGDTSTRSCVMSSMRHVRRAEQERLAHAALEHHLLIELADAGRSTAARRPSGRRRRGRGRESCPRWRWRRASRPRERRACSATRSHVTRGRSSANSSDG